MTVKRVLTIGCSDSSGSSGIQADLEAFAALGVRGVTAVTVVTAQNTRGIRRAHRVPPRVVAAQIDAVVRDIGIDAAKTGMLGSWQIVEAVAERARRRRIPNLVVDPAMTAEGARLLGARAAELLRRRLLPWARLVTPSAQEAEWLTGIAVRDPAGMRAAAEALAATGVGAVLIRGGDMPGTPLDLFYEKGVFYELPALEPACGRGAECGVRSAVKAGPALSHSAAPFPASRGGYPTPHASAASLLTAALAARLALGDELLEALVFARAFAAEG